MIIYSMLFLIFIIKLIFNSIDVKINEITKKEYINYQLIDVIHYYTPNISVIQNFFHLLNYILFIIIFFHKKVDTVVFLQKLFKIQFFHSICNYSTILPLKPSLNNCNSSILHSCHNLFFSSNVAIILLYSYLSVELF